MSKKFSVTLLERNAKGELTGRKKSFSSDNAYKIWEFYNRNSPGTKQRRRKSNSAAKSSSDNIKKWVKEANEYSLKKSKEDG